MKIEALGNRLGFGKDIKFEKASGFKYPVAEVPDEQAVKILRNEQFREAQPKKGKKAEPETE